MRPRNQAGQQPNKTKRAEQCIQDLTRRVLQGECCLTLADLTALGDACNLASPPLPRGHGDSMVLFIVVDEESAAGLASLLSLTLRRSGFAGVPAVDDTLRVAYRKLRKTLADQLMSQACRRDNDCTAQRQRLLRDLMLRTDVLRCYSALLCEAGQLVKQRPSRRNVETTDALLEEVVGHLWKMLPVIDESLRSKIIESRPSDATADQSYPTSSYEHFCMLLLREIAYSSLIDSWAACYLGLLGCGEWSPTRATYLLRNFAMVVCTDVFKAYLLSPSYQSQPRALSYLMTAHVVGLVSLCDGGTSYGLTNVMPFAPVWDIDNAAVSGDSDRAQLSNRARVGGSGAPGGRVLCLSLCLPVLQAWCKSMTAKSAETAADELASGSRADPAPHAATAMLPPLHKRATLDICIRLFNAAAGLGDSTNPASMAATSTPGQRRSPMMTLKPLMRAHVMSMALDIAVAMLQRLLGNGGAGGRGGDQPVGLRPADLKQLGALWTAYVRVLGAALDSEPPRQVQDAGRGLDTSWTLFSEEWRDVPVITIAQLLPSPDVSIPGGLGPEATAVVDSGAIPVMERLVRQRNAAAKPLCGSAVWTELLMFGPMDQIAALIASLAKRVSAATARVDRLNGMASMSTCWHLCNDPRVRLPGSGLQEAIITASKFLAVLAQRKAARRLARTLLESAPRPVEQFEDNSSGGGGSEDGRNGTAGDSDAAAPGAIAGARQLLTLSCTAALGLLPPLAKALQVFKEFFRGVPNCPRRCEDALQEAMAEILTCCALPLEAAPAEEAASAAPASAPTASTRVAAFRAGTAAEPAPPSASLAVAKWRALLLREVNVIRLLRDIMDVMDYYYADPEDAGAVKCRHAMAATYRWAQRMFPQEVIAAGLEPPSAHPETQRKRRKNAKRQSVGDGEREAVDLTYTKEEEEALAAVLPMPEELRRSMAPYRCANPRCLNMEGDSELALPRRRCSGGCGGRLGWYCCGECLLVHWKEEHKEECLAAKAAAEAKEECRAAKAATEAKEECRAAKAEAEAKEECRAAPEKPHSGRGRVPDSCEGGGGGEGGC